MSILQEPPTPPLPVICDFFFEQAGPPGIVAYDGDTYPYPPLPSDKGNDYRYAWGTTPIFLPVEFFGIAHTVGGKVQPHVIAPPGITILEYFWDFGDGYTGHGPIVTHIYEVPDPTTSISLTILDSLGREFSTSKALSLLIVDFGYIYTRIRGQNTETPPKRQQAETKDFAITIEGTPTRTIIARGGKKFREQSEKVVSNDRAFVLTHFYRSTIDQSLLKDIPQRRRNIFRNTIDKSITSDISKRKTQRFANTIDKALTKEGQPMSTFVRPLSAIISFISVGVGLRPHKGLYPHKGLHPTPGNFQRNILHTFEATLAFIGNLTHKP